VGGPVRLAAWSAPDHHRGNASAQLRQTPRADARFCREWARLAWSVPGWARSQEVISRVGAGWRAQRCSPFHDHRGMLMASGTSSADWW